MYHISHWEDSILQMAKSYQIIPLDTFPLSIW